MTDYDVPLFLAGPLFRSITEPVNYFCALIDQDAAFMLTMLLSEVDLFGY